MFWRRIKDGWRDMPGWAWVVVVAIVALTAWRLLSIDPQAAYFETKQ